ncbi:unnamed protein product [Ambrosiozyma monospora]|uniref:Unnamed protein product n=1 Tax=Ambrosiozyma monospora TaxID=43982 RepID=A0A9W6SZP9_AMBMO|nr:unnamed protein product [Ambrosiozyma monospora]
MDGFHLPISILKKFKDPENAIKMRGATHTFDAAMVVQLFDFILDTCRYTVDQPAPTTNTETKKSAEQATNPYWKLDKTEIPRLSVPDFNHALKDPTPNGTLIGSTTRVVIFEGLYLMLDGLEKWDEIPNTVRKLRSQTTTTTIANTNTNNSNNNNNTDFMTPTPTPTPSSTPTSASIRMTAPQQRQSDTNINPYPHPHPHVPTVDIWHIKTTTETAQDRVANRHMEAKLCDDLEKAIDRYRFNDFPNGEVVEFGCDSKLVDLVVLN